MKINKIIPVFTLAALFLAGILSFKSISPDADHPAKANNNGLETGFAVVELFTSEGCSSCPPADELVAKIVKEDKDKPVYVLGYHVDYWNHLGWKDEFSKAEYSERQKQYASWLKLEGVYTPQIVVNGKKEFVGSDESKLRGAIQSGLHMTNNEAIMLITVSFSKSGLSLQYQTKSNIRNRNLLVAFVQKNAQSNVKSGENGGHMLTHVNIVRSLNTLGLKQNGNENIKLPANFNPQTWDVIGFVQDTNTGEIVSAQKITAQGI